MGTAQYNTFAPVSNRVKAFSVALGISTLPIFLFISLGSSTTQPSSNSLHTHPVSALLLDSVGICITLLIGIVALLHYLKYSLPIVSVAGTAALAVATLDLFHLIAQTQWLDVGHNKTALQGFTWPLNRNLSAGIFLMTLCYAAWVFRSQINALTAQENSAAVQKPYFYAIHGLIGLTVMAAFYLISSDHQLPQAHFEGSLIKTPWETLALAVWILVFSIAWQMSKNHQDLYIHAIMASIVPNIVMQVCATFWHDTGITYQVTLLHSLKIFSYGVLLMGLILDLANRSTTKSAQHAYPLDIPHSNYPNQHNSTHLASNSQKLPIGKPKHPLGIKLPIATFLLAITIAFGASFSFYFEAERIVLNEQAERLRSESNLLKPLLADLYNQASSDLIFLSHTPPVINYIEAVAENDIDEQKEARSQLAQIFTEILSSKPFLVQASYIGTANQGQEILRVVNNGWAIQNMPQTRLQQLAETDLFKSASIIDPGSIHYSEAQLMRENGVIAKPHREIIKAATPIFDPESGEFFGLISIVINFGAFMQEMVQENLAGIDFYLANATGDFLYHPNQDYSFGFEFGSRYRLQDEFPELEDVIEKQIKERAFASLLNKANQSYSSYYQLIQLDEFGSRHALQLLLQHSNQTTDIELSAFRNHSLILGACISLLALALAITVTRRVVQPLSDISDAVQKYEYTGRLDELPTASKDEIGVLARSFHNFIHQMEASQKYIEGITESAPVLLAYVDLDLRYQFVNKTFEEWYHSPVSNILGSKLEDGFDPDTYQKLKPYIDRTLSGETTAFNMDIPDADGHIRYIKGTFTPDFNERAKTKGFFVSIDDITESKTAEMAMKELSERMEFALKAPRIGIWEFNLLTEELIWDKRMYKIYATKPHQFNGQLSDWESLVHPDDLEPTNELFVQCLENGEDFNTEFRIICPSGETRHLEAHARIIKDSQGQPTRIVGTNIDITDRKILANEREKALSAAKASTELKSQFLASMSHEIRTPMNGVLGMLDLLLKTNLDDHQREQTRIARYSAESLLGIINDILDFSKIEAGKLELDIIDCDLFDEFQFLAQTMQYKVEEKSLELLFVLDNVKHQYIQTDPTRLRQILINLVSNAIKFTEQGRITVTAQTEQQSDGHIQFTCSVEDTGIGMSAEQAAGIFNSFTQVDASTTRKYGGTGLGLAIVKQLCGLMAGDISVTSTPNQGSCFTFYLQMTEAEAVNHNTEVHHNPGVHQNAQAHQHLTAHDSPSTVFNNSSSELTITDPKSARILLVEDNPINQMLAEELLKELGLSCDTAENGQLALNILSNIDQAYDLILMDCQMPELDGYATTEKIRQGDAGQQHQTTPIMAMTANAMKGDKEKCLAAGMDDYISKPIDPAILEQRLVHWLALRNTSEESNTSEKSMAATLMPSAPPSSVPPQPLNPTWDQASALKRLMGKESKLKKLAQIFISTLPSEINQLIQAIDDEQLDTIQTMAHSLKGMTANLSAIQLQALSSQIERLAKQQDVEAIKALVSDLKAAELGLCQTLQDFLDADLDANQDNQASTLEPPDSPQALSEQVIERIQITLDHLTEDLHAGNYIDTDDITLFQSATHHPGIDEQLKQLSHELVLLNTEAAFHCIEQLKAIIDQEAQQINHENTG